MFKFLGKNNHMNEPSMLMALAELDGMIDIRLERSMGEKCVTGCWDGNLDCRSMVKDYLLSYDEIKTLINKQKFNVQVSVIHHVFEQVAIKHDSDWRTEDILFIMMATPKQWCIALLKATNKWKED